MFERYTDRALRSVLLAQDHAQRLNHPQIEGCHLLLGLAAEGESTAAQALGNVGLTPGAIEYAIVHVCPPGEHPVIGHIPFTPGAERILALATEESRKLGRTYIGAEHLLLGLVTNDSKGSDSTVIRILNSFGVTTACVREEVMDLLRSYGDLPPGQ